MNHSLLESDERGLPLAVLHLLPTFVLPTLMSLFQSGNEICLCKSGLSFFITRDRSEIITHLRGPPNRCSLFSRGGRPNILISNSKCPFVSDFVTFYCAIVRSQRVYFSSALMSFVIGVLHSIRPFGLPT